MTNICGVYYIFNTISKRWYIGSSKNVEGRLLHHFKMLEHPTKLHDNSHLQRAFDSYGKDAFESGIILTCQPELRRYYERQIVKQLKPDVYNIAEVEDAFFEGHIHTEETKQKMSLSQTGNQHLKGHTWTEEQKHKMSEARKAENLSEETRHKLSESHKVENLSEETRRKNSESLIGNTRMKGHKHTEESKRKMRGRKHTEESKHKMSETRKGIKASEEAKHNMSEAQKKRFAKERAEKESKQ